MNIMTSLAAAGARSSRHLALEPGTILIPAGLLLGLAYLAYDGIRIRPLMLLATWLAGPSRCCCARVGPRGAGPRRAAAIPLQFGTAPGHAVAATLLVPALGALWLAHGLRRRLTWTASPADRPWLLFLAAGLLSSLRDRPRHRRTPRCRSRPTILVQLAQWAIFAFAALAYWLPGMLLRGPRDAGG